MVPRFGHWIPLGYAYFSAYALFYAHQILYKVRLGPLAEWLQRNVWVVVEFPVAAIRACDSFDMITPHKASVHEPEEVAAWLKDACCKTVEDLME